MNLIYLLFIFLINWSIFVFVNHGWNKKMYLAIILFSLFVIIHIIQFSLVQLMSIDDFFSLIFPSIALLIIYYMSGTIESSFEENSNTNPALVQPMLKISRFIRNKLMVVLTTILQMLIIFIPSLRH